LRRQSGRAKTSERKEAVDTLTIEAVVAVAVIAVPPLALVALAATRATPRQLTEMLAARDSH
jgi:hypothetical protein